MVIRKRKERTAPRYHQPVRYEINSDYVPPKPKKPRAKRTKAAMGARKRWENYRKKEKGTLTYRSEYTGLPVKDKYTKQDQKKINAEFRKKWSRENVRTYERDGKVYRNVASIKKVQRGEAYVNSTEAAYAVGLESRDLWYRAVCRLKVRTWVTKKRYVDKNKWISTTYFRNEGLAIDECKMIIEKMMNEYKDIEILEVGRIQVRVRKWQ